MTSHPARIRPRERFLARVIAVLLVGGIATAVLPAVADPVMAAIRSLAPEAASEDPEPPLQVVVTPETAPPPAPPSAAPPQSAPAEAPPEVEAAVVEATPLTEPPTTAAPTTTTTTFPSHASPPKAGTYTYRVQSNGDGGSRESEWTLEVDPAQEVEGETRQVHRRPDSEIREAHWAWRGDGLYLDAERVVSGDLDFVCTFEPPVLLYPFPLEVGRAWENDSKCTYQAGPEYHNAKITRYRRGTPRITGFERITVGGEKVDAYEIETSGDNRTDGTGSVYRTSEFFAPSVGLPARTERHSQRYEGNEPVGETRSTTELVSLAPR